MFFLGESYVNCVCLNRPPQCLFYSLCSFLVYRNIFTQHEIPPWDVVLILVHKWEMCQEIFKLQGQVNVKGKIIRSENCFWLQSTTVFYSALSELYLLIKAVFFCTYFITIYIYMHVYILNSLLLYSVKLVALIFMGEHYQSNTSNCIIYKIIWHVFKAIKWIDVKWKHLCGLACVC